MKKCPVSSPILLCTEEWFNVLWCNITIIREESEKYWCLLYLQVQHESKHNMCLPAGDTFYAPILRVHRDRQTSQVHHVTAVLKLMNRKRSKMTATHTLSDTISVFVMSATCLIVASFVTCTATAAAASTTAMMPLVTAPSGLDKIPIGKLLSLSLLLKVNKHTALFNSICSHMYNCISTAPYTSALYIIVSVQLDWAVEAIVSTARESNDTELCVHWKGNSVSKESKCKQIQYSSWYFIRKIYFWHLSSTRVAMNAAGVIKCLSSHRVSIKKCYPPVDTHVYTQMFSSYWSSHLIFFFFHRLNMLLSFHSGHTHDFTQSTIISLSPLSLSLLYYSNLSQVRFLLQTQMIFKVHLNTRFNFTILTRLQNSKLKAL